MKKTLLILGLSLLLTLSSCSSKESSQRSAEEERIDLVFYGLFDNEEIYKPIIEAYESENPNVSIHYRKFTNPNEALEIVVNEIAEGEGPDIFMLHNMDFPKHYKKLTPAPVDLMSPQNLADRFAEVTMRDLVYQEKVWGMPLYVDTLALYYNQSHFAEVLNGATPEKTWEGLVNQVVALNKQDNSFERFFRSGIALGRGENILRATDILQMLFLQNDVAFSDPENTESRIASDPNAPTPFNLFMSFGLPSQPTYSWNRYLAPSRSSEKEITTFARGKTSMIFGYSYNYGAIVNEISRLKSLEQVSIEVNDIQIAQAPQMERNLASPVNFASYFVPVVSRSSEHPEEAWSFLISLSSVDNQKYLFEKTHKASAVKLLNKDQVNDPIYGVFAEQVPSAQSVWSPDKEALSKILLKAIESGLQTRKTETILGEIESEFQELIESNRE